MLPNRIFPKTLKNRLFAAYIVLILIPFAIMNVYVFREMEEILQDQVAERSHEQLEQMNQSLENVMSVAFDSLLLLEQDTEVQAALKHPNLENPLDAKYRIEEKFRSIGNSLFMTSPQVFFTLLDFHGNVYSSFVPKERLDYGVMTSQQWYKDLISGKVNRSWVDNDANYVSPDLSTSPYLISLFAVLLDENGKSYGVARISLDYSQWLDAVVRTIPEEQNYYILAENGQVVAHSGANDLTAATTQQLIASNDSGYFVDDVSETMINYSPIESVDWYMVNRIPLNVLYGEIDALKRKFAVIFAGLTILFVIITFLISKTITRPLYHLQKKMREVVAKDFKVKVQEDKFSGEILDLTRTFNRMTDDMNELIGKVKTEQRQKEAVHFQMLLSQLNPHFLLNTLNIVKWLALRKQEHEIADVCVSLGSLLETSLNSEIELIPLKDELRLIDSYLLIQSYKHKRRIKVAFEVPEELQYALVPKLSLQPLVENAVNHGFPADRDGTIIVSANRENSAEAEERIRLCVKDDGQGMEKAKSAQAAGRRKSTGIGLRNIQERLQLIFRGNSEFKIDSTDEGTIVRYAIPLLLSVPYREGGSTDVDGIVGGR